MQVLEGVVHDIHTYIYIYIYHDPPKRFKPKSYVKRSVLEALVIYGAFE